MRRDLQETFLRLTDASILLAGRAIELGGWIRKSIVEMNGDAESIHSIKEKPEELEVLEEKRPQVLSSQAHDVRFFVLDS